MAFLWCLNPADLRSANLHDAVFKHTNLSGADLRGVDLHDVDLSQAILDGAIFE